MKDLTPEEKNYRIVEYGALAAVFLALYYLSVLLNGTSWEPYVPFFQKLTMSATLISIIFLIGKIIERIIDTHAEVKGHRYNLIRITRLLTTILALTIAAAFIFQSQEYAAWVVGLASLILGFALQEPIASFIAWLYIIFRGTYKVGDRIQIQEHRGDVIEVGYFDTIMEEVSGEYLGNDRKSGRYVYFPNSMILKGKVVNYSGGMVPFIWNETAIQISYTSDLEFVEDCLREATISDFKKQYPYRDLHGNEPDVYFRINNYAWLEAVVSYPVEPADTTGRRNRILRNALPLLNAQPERVQFPEGTRR